MNGMETIKIALTLIIWYGLQLRLTFNKQILIVFISLYQETHKKFKSISKIKKLNKKMSFLIKIKLSSYFWNTVIEVKIGT